MKKIKRNIQAQKKEITYLFRQIDDIQQQLKHLTAMFEQMNQNMKFSDSQKALLQTNNSVDYQKQQPNSFEQIGKKRSWKCNEDLITYEIDNSTEMDLADETTRVIGKGNE